MATISKEKAASLYLAIEELKGMGFSPMNNGRNEITDQFEGLKVEFGKVLTAEQKKNIEDAENALYEYYDNFYTYSDDKLDDILAKANKYLDLVSPYFTEEQADKWL